VIGEGSRIAPTARLVGPACLGPNCEIGPGCVIERAVLWGGVRVGTNTTIASAIVGREVSIGADCLVAGDAVIGEYATIGPSNTLVNGVRIAPRCTIPAGAIQFAVR
jgi:NDP-sugar pyrophosphorylase family protein